MRAMGIGLLAVLCVTLTAGTVMLTARGQSSKPGDIGENHVVVDNRVQVAGTVTIDPAKAVSVHPTRQTWEYRIVTIASGKEPGLLLTNAGLDGWEAVGFQSGPGGGSVLLKRPR